MSDLGAAVILADTFDMHDWDSGTWIVMMLGMLIVWAVIIVGAVWLVREVGGSRGERGRSDPLDVLRHRLAAGEISLDEYERRRAALGD